MDPFVATIVRQAAVIVGCFLAVGFIVALAFAFSRYSKLQYALTLDMVPPPLA